MRGTMTVGFSQPGWEMPVNLGHILVQPRLDGLPRLKAWLHEVINAREIRRQISQLLQYEDSR